MKKDLFFVNQGGRVSSDVGKPLANIFETLALYCPTQQFCYSLNFYILWLKIFFSLLSISTNLLQLVIYLFYLKPKKLQLV